MREQTVRMRNLLWRRGMPCLLVTLLLFPGAPAAAYDVMISSAASQGGSWSGGNPDLWTATATGANVSIADIQARIALTDVVITSNNEGAEQGDISLVAPLAWSAETTLTLAAYRNIAINADLTATGNMAGITNIIGTDGNCAVNANISLAGSYSLTIIGTPYAVIHDVDGLQAINANLSGNYILGADIDAAATSGWNSGAGFVPLGSGDGATSALPFTGTFNGLNHTISNLVIHRPASANVGLFGKLAAGGSIANVGLLDEHISGGSAVGGLVGYNDGGLITHSHATGSVNGDIDVGALIGVNTGSVIESYSLAIVNESVSAGGLIGTSMAGTVSNTSLVWQGTVFDGAGGLVGQAGAEPTLSLFWLTDMDPIQFFAELTDKDKVFLANGDGVLFGGSAIFDASGSTLAGILSMDSGISTVSTFMAALAKDMQVRTGWNLLGNVTDAALEVATALGDAAKVASVWKWEAGQGRWAFYTPQQADGGAAYAVAHGYDLLTTVNSGEGFWVKATAPFMFALPVGKLLPMASAVTACAPGWNMISIGEVATASEFNAALSQTQAATGSATLWAWDSEEANWYFYSPAMEAQGGTVLADYIAGKGYRDFMAKGKTLGPGVGVWVNMP